MVLKKGTQHHFKGGTIGEFRVTGFAHFFNIEKKLEIMVSWLKRLFMGCFGQRIRTAYPMRAEIFSVRRNGLGYLWSKFRLPA